MYTSIPVTAVVPTATTAPPGTNSVFFETYPPGATIFLDGENVGTTPFTYYTNRKGTFDVLARQDGYEKYEAKVTILEGKLVHFTAPLTVYSPTPTTVTTTVPPTTVKTTAPQRLPPPRDECHDLRDNRPSPGNDLNEHHNPGKDPRVPELLDHHPDPVGNGPARSTKIAWQVPYLQRVFSSSGSCSSCSR